jgi:hypothetical protein
LRAFCERSFGGFQEKPFNAVWRFSPNAAAGTNTFLFHPIQKLGDQPDGSLIVFKAGGRSVKITASGYDRSHERTYTFAHPATFGTHKARRHQRPLKRSFKDLDRGPV